MTDAAFIFALTLGVIVLGGMLWVSHTASTQLAARRGKRVYASGASEGEPDLFDVTDVESAGRADREIRKRVKESAH